MTLHFWTHPATLSNLQWRGKNSFPWPEIPSINGRQRQNRTGSICLRLLIICSKEHRSPSGAGSPRLTFYSGCTRVQEHQTVFIGFANFQTSAVFFLPRSCFKQTVQVAGSACSNWTPHLLLPADLCNRKVCRVIPRKSDLFFIAEMTCIVFHSKVTLVLCQISDIEFWFLRESEEKKCTLNFSSSFLQVASAHSCHEGRAGRSREVQRRFSLCPGCGGEGSWHRDLMQKEKQKSHCQGFPLLHSSAGDPPHRCVV